MIRRLAWWKTNWSMVDRQAGIAQRGLRRLGQLAGGVLVDLLARHVHEVAALGHRLQRGGAGRATGREDDPVGATPVAVHVKANQTTRLLAGGDDDGARSVAEQDARGAVRVVEEATEHLNAEHEHVAIHAAPHKGGGGRQREDEAGAGGHHVEAGRARRPELVAHEDGRRRHVVVGRARAEDDEVEIGRVEAGNSQGVARGMDAQSGGRLVVRRDATLADPRAAHDPLVGGLDHCRQVVVRHHPRRRVHPPAGDQCIRGHRGAPWQGR